ncbi:hypothetical protein SAMN05661096_03956 [Marivirga sericea]|uniref:Uncharacterized protein n=1 Tax=Marivirga sericea TaxID=1028 RepID=A0A1X7LFA8_9BACT|nr:hypothetical protein [Marivirga sericea]SMG52531.1 hypothetical protein SAMN05661096_03956 [Marivirga sericea]
MSKSQDKFRLFFYGLFTLASVIILLDFFLPGRKVVDEIVSVQKERQQYYNAARNFHYSYKVSTSQHDFYISGDYAQEIEANEKIGYAVSWIFNEVNTYRLLRFEDSETNSLRLITGMLMPILVLITMSTAYLLKKKMSTLVFVMQVLLIVDLVLLLI